MLKKIRLKGMFVKSNERKKRERKKKKTKENLERERTFSYSSPRLLFGETIDTASRNVGGKKRKKKFLSIAVDNRLIEQIDFVSGSRVDRSIELSRRIINTFQTL